MSLNNLPGVKVKTVDGGLAARRVPRTKSTVVLGTSEKGVFDDPFQVIDRGDAASAFGVVGSLTRGMEEVAAFSDNVFLMRIGTKAGQLTKVGGIIAGNSDGFTIEPGTRQADTGTAYSIWYDGEQIIYIWKGSELVFANDIGTSVVDTSDTVVTGSSDGSATPFGDQGGQAKTLAGAFTFIEAAAEPPIALSEQALWAAPITGVGATNRELYVAQEDALQLLANFPINQLFMPGVVLDTPNVALKDAVDDISTGVVLDWLLTTTDPLGTLTYHWASEALDSKGAVVADPGLPFADAAARDAKGYHEVNYGYQMARFCAAQQEVLGGCLGFIGTSGPINFTLQRTREWIGFLPIFNANGEATTTGSGLLGISYMVGTTAGELDAAAFDQANGFRLPGFFENSAGEYDGGASLDKNSNKIDIGAYLHIVGDWALITNGFSTYKGNIAGVVAGHVSALDEKSSTTNKQAQSITQLHKGGLAQLDSLTFAKINMLRFKAAGTLPVLLHGMTAATSASDYTNLVRQRIKFLVTQTLFEEADKFIGESSTDNLQLEALQTVLENKFLNLQKRGYISRFNITVSASDADRKVGLVNMDINFMPADELIQLNASVGISRR